MFATQLTGVFKRLEEKEEFSFEDGARLLAQGPAGDGSIYILGFGEMKAIEAEAVDGAEPLKHVRAFASVEELSVADRVIVVTRFSDDAEAVAVARQLQEKGILFVGISTVRDREDGGAGLDELADVHIDLALKKGLLPDEFGGRFGYPSAIAGLFAYYGLKFIIEEILTEYEE